MGNFIGEILGGDKSPVQNRDSVIYLSTMHAIDWIAPNTTPATEQQPNANNYLNYSPLTAPQATSQETSAPSSVTPSEIDMHIETIRNAVAAIHNESGEDN